MLKDRTAELFKIRQGLHNDQNQEVERRKRDEAEEIGHVDNENDTDYKCQRSSNPSGNQRNGNGSTSGDVIIEMGPLGTSLAEIEFFQQIDEAWKQLAELQQSVKDVRGLHSTIVSSPNPDEATQQKLQQLMTAVNSTSREMRTKLKDINAHVCKKEKEATGKSDDEDEDEDEPSTAHFRIAQTQHSALLRLFVETMFEFDRAQTDYRDRCKSRIYRQLEINESCCPDDEVERIIEEGNWAGFTQGIFKGRTTEEAREMLADIEARHRDLIKLETSIRELHDMFMEMAFLIENHGDVLDGIEIHVAAAQERVYAAKEQLVECQAAKVSMDKNQMCLYVIVITATVTVLMIFFIVYFTW